ncbi:MAG TPA: LacI family DNA-binding transcriptional regulator [Burkholderiales bacterium]|nr:LacI family DNA-binding transcriptional regulator [Burkholderiales bacterium]
MKQNTPKKTAKLSDVARLARVSTATVSRALTLPHKVKPLTLSRVQQAVQTLGYVAHGAARALASRRTRTIGAVIPTLDNAIFANTIHALQKALDEAGYMLLLASHEFNADIEVRATRALIERGIDGLVLLGMTHQPGLFTMIEAHQIPYVLTWALDESGRHPCVGFNNRAAAIRLANYLLDLGHREFAMISGITATNERAQERLEGVREALAAKGARLPAGRIVEKPFTLSAGREGLREVMAGPAPPTAVICGNDVLAIGAMAECNALGIAVPRQASITGFDDMEIASLMTPGLTTVRFPTAELGAYAANYLLSRLAGKNVNPMRELAVELIVRGTTAPPPRGNG